MNYQCQLLGSGGKVDHVPGEDIAAGQVVIINGMFLFATQPIKAGERGTLYTAGGPPLIRLAKDDSEFAVGNGTYWNPAGNPVGGTEGSGCATTTAAGNIFIGRCVAAAASTAESVDSEMAIGVVTSNLLENALADPGHEGAIPVTRTGRLPIVSVGVETRALAAPTFAGQQILLYLKTDGGNVTLTCATALNETGNNTAVFADVGDSLLLTAVEEGADLRWRLAQADGVALSTV